MDGKAISTQTVSLTRRLLDDFEEKSFDGDFVLPDYLPEMAAILNCRLEPVIENRQLSGNRLIVDGTVYVNVLYVDQSRSRLYTYEVSQPFNASFTADGMTGPTAVSLETTVSYVNYRAIGPRRLDVRGAYRVHAEILDTVCEELPEYSNDATVFLRRRELEETLPVESVDKVFAVNDLLDPGNGASPSAVIRSGAVASVTDCKVLPGRVIIKGEILICTLTCVGEGENVTYQRTEHTLLYSQMMDIKGLRDTDRVCVNVGVLTCDVHPETEEGTGKVMLVAALRLSANVSVWRTVSCFVITDAYSSVCPLTLSFEEKPTYGIVGTFDRQIPLTRQVELPEGVTEIVDLWCSCQPVSFADGVSHERLQVYLLAKDENGGIACYERSVDFSVELPVTANAPRFTCRVWRCDYRLKEERALELSVLLDVFGQDIHRGVEKCVVDLTPESGEGYPPPACTLKMIFAEKGESVWGIAKACHTSAEAILSENALTEDTLSEDCLLMIPIG